MWAARVTTVGEACVLPSSDRSVHYWLDSARPNRTDGAVHAPPPTHPSIPRRSLRRKPALRRAAGGWMEPAPHRAYVTPHARARSRRMRRMAARDAPAARGSRLRVLLLLPAMCHVLAPPHGKAAFPSSLVDPSSVGSGVAARGLFSIERAARKLGRDRSIDRSLFTAMEEQDPAVLPMCADRRDKMFVYCALHWTGSSTRPVRQTG